MFKKGYWAIFVFYVCFTIFVYTSGSIGVPVGRLRDTIAAYESAGYTVEFKTSFFIRLFGTGYYKMVAYRK